MRVLWVFAHPEPRSLSGALRDAGVRWLEDAGHQVMVSDLYAMGWNPIVSGEDFAHDARERLIVGDASALAYASGRLSADIVEEQRKIAWADTLVFQFPLWWYGMPAILKGWFDRIFVKGFAFGVNDPGTGQTLRYGQGNLSGKTAMVVTSVGARESSIGPRGINGEINELLFPLQHGTLWYTGISVVPPLVVHGADRAAVEDYELAVKQLRGRLQELPETPPIRFRCQNGGDYDGRLELRSDIAPGQRGPQIHVDDNERIAPAARTSGGDLTG